MAELILKSRRFREEREAQWQRLEALLDRVERGSIEVLTDDEMIALPVLYRSTLSSLSVARAISLDQSLIAYLESLSTRAYFFVYGARTTFLARINRFFAEDWPAAVRDLWRETAVAVFLTLLGVALGYALTARDPSWFYALVPDQWAQGRDPTATTQALRQSLFQSPVSGLSVFATYLFTHNAQIALFAFALGIAFCVPSAALVLFNAMVLGAFFSLYTVHGLGVVFGGWVLIHGTTELFAIVLSAAAGLRLGWTLGFPGPRTRPEAMRAAGRTAATMMMGTLVMLGVAGLLEGIARQVITDTTARYAIAAGALSLWCLYFYRPRQASA